VVGTVPDEAAAALVDRCVAEPDTLVIASSDLSHYLPYDTATARDRDTVDCIVSRDPDGIGPDDACGRHPVRGLLASSAAAAWTPEVLDLRNSGDTAGDRHAVVGYTSIVFC
jgi:AmmeMemoRadiSam system protein B